MDLSHKQALRRQLLRCSAVRLALLLSYFSSHLRGRSGAATLCCNIHRLPMPQRALSPDHEELQSLETVGWPFIAEESDERFVEKG